MLEFLRQTLPNGLEIVAECAPEAYSMALGFFVKTGARDETADVAGVSHFLEHMAFKGTPTRTADDVNRQFDEMGAHYNAYTSEEATVFHAAVLPEQQSAALGLLADILRPSLRAEDFETEKQVILEEIRMYEDQPPFGAEDKCRAAYFGQHPLGQSVLGTAESIQSLDAEAMRVYFSRRYNPANVVLAAAGQVDFPALVAGAERFCGGWQPGPAGRTVLPAAARFGLERLTKDTATQQYVVQFSPGPDASAADRYPAKLLATVVGDDTGSRFYWELVDPGLVEQASLSHYEFEGAGLFISYFSCEPEDAGENLDRVRQILQRVGRDGVSAAELAQAKNKVNSRVVLSGERPRGRLFIVGSDWIQRREYRTTQDDLDAVASITLADLEAVLARYTLTDQMTVTIGPG